jgi:hypothetical protein
MSNLQTFAGSCHCGKVRLETELDLGSTFMTCNCSICGRTGAVMAFVPAEQVVVHSGEEGLTDYQFGKKHIHHQFCSTCGVRPFAHGKAPDGKTTYAINVRCLEGVDVGALKLTQFDGKSL